MDKSAKTTISRIRLSAPARWLFTNGHMKGTILDYGCGKGDIFRHWLSRTHGDQYDPNFFPEKPSGTFNTVYCGFVMNVLSLDKRNAVLEDIKTFLASDGVAYLAVRRDIKKEGLTLSGTEQYNVILNLPLVYEKKGRYAIYEMKEEVKSSPYNRKESNES